MRGIIGFGTYLPVRRLDLSQVAGIAGSGGRKGQRTVASFDEDATTMAVEAGRALLAAYRGPAPTSLWYSTVNPPYLDRTNAGVAHAALRLARSAPAYDVVGSVRSGFGALRAAAAQSGPALVLTSDLRVGPPGGPDESYFGDGAAALLVGDGDGSPVLAEILGWVSVSEEFQDRWRTPGDVRSKVWEERFGEVRYVQAGTEAVTSLLEQTGIDEASVAAFLVTGTHGRAVKALAGRFTMKGHPMADELTARAGDTGAAHPALLLSAALDGASPGDIFVLVGLADGAEALAVRATDAIGTWRSGRTTAEQLDSGALVAYGRYLAWRGLLPVEPPRRPEPARVSAPAAERGGDWKYGLVGSRSEGGKVHLPPAIGDDERLGMSSAQGTVRTFTIDRLSYSPSPPLVFAVVDFDGGGRLPIELTDVDASDVAVGDRVEMTFRRLSSADGIHNYFWKARPARSSTESRV